MWMHDPRTLILRALLLDAAGQLLILSLILWIPSLLGWTIGGSSLEGQGGWLLFSLLLYPLLGWLFGSYTVLRWRRLTLPVLLQRLVITAAVSVMVVALARWLINPGDAVWLVYRRVQLVWMVALTGWALLVRLALRRGLLLPDAPRLLLLAQPDETHTVLTAWRRVPHRQRLSPVGCAALATAPGSTGTAAAGGCECGAAPRSQPARAAGESRDARSPRCSKRVGAQPV